MEPLMRCRPEERTWRQKVRLLRQRLYLWRRFRNQDIVTKRKLAKALRNRLTVMSRTEAVPYRLDSGREGYNLLRAVERRHLRERKMIVSILADMYSRFSGPEHLGI